MAKRLFTISEQSDLAIAAYKLVEDANMESYLDKLEKIFVAKLFDAAETERLLKIKS